jgi:hypothetical protein
MKFNYVLIRLLDAVGADASLARPRPGARQKGVWFENVLKTYWLLSLIASLPQPSTN